MGFPRVSDIGPHYGSKHGVPDRVPDRFRVSDFFEGIFRKTFLLLWIFFGLIEA